jgi:starch phosphorylase
MTRLAQYVLLGAGGVRALSALGIDPGAIHLNEGHAALAPLALAGTLRDGDGVQAALAAARERTAFTTHTPVAAGNDAYPASQVHDAIGVLTERLSLPEHEVIALGRTDPADDQQPFGMTQAALRMSAAANAVSRRHGDVAREMWASLWPDRPVDEVRSAT